jgi:hypothetical protein
MARSPKTPSRVLAPLTEVLHYARPVRKGLVPVSNSSNCLDGDGYFRAGSSAQPQLLVIHARNTAVDVRVALLDQDMVPIFAVAAKGSDDDQAVHAALLPHLSGESHYISFWVF